MPAPPNVPTDRLGLFRLDEAIAAGWTPDGLRHAVAPAAIASPPPRDLRDTAVDSGGSFRCGPPAARARRGRGELGESGRHSQSRGCGCLASLAAVAPWSGPLRHRGTAVRGRYRGHASASRAVAVRAQHQARRQGDHSVARTIVDLGREQGALSALVTADAALHTGRVDLDTLRRRVGECAGWPGVRAARQAITLADGRAESPLETASRYHLNGRVPIPELQVWIYDLDGAFIGRGDFYWDEGVVGEADGMAKYGQQQDPNRRACARRSCARSASNGWASRSCGGGCRTSPTSTPSFDESTTRAPEPGPRPHRDAGRQPQQPSPLCTFEREDSVVKAPRKGAKRDS